MNTQRFQKSQDLDDWSEMLFAIYGPSSNYAKSTFEIYTHLAEVVGVLGKLVFKKRDRELALSFIPKVLAWSLALHKSLPGKPKVEEIILNKFPTVCPYCIKRPCECWIGEEPTISDDELRRQYFAHAPNQGRSLNDFQLMFRRIYGHTWPIATQDNVKHPNVTLEFLFIRLTEELGEIAEALRFHHLYPKNFQNEFADFFAWWIAFSTCLISESENNILTIEDLIWPSYPGHCNECQMLPCHCRPGPIREMMSKPPPGFEHRTDGLTSLLNQGAYLEDIKAVRSGDLVITLPFACCRFDVDDFKNINDSYGHNAGDMALKHIGSVIQKKAGEKARCYRISGDEFGLLLPDKTEEEAAGLATRICNALKISPVRWVDKDGKVFEFTVGVSAGVSQGEEVSAIDNIFENADKASFASKEDGKGKVSKASDTLEK